ncbi:hypothetical protein BCEP4_540115 [Burkholderia cepacia]|nr:hypothetical protein BCEP4_540115 [Burkholderia cepacia]
MADAVCAVGRGIRIAGRGQIASPGDAFNRVLVQAGTHRRIPSRRCAGRFEKAIAAPACASSPQPL